VPVTHIFLSFRRHVAGRDTCGGGLALGGACATLFVHVRGPHGYGDRVAEIERPLLLVQGLLWVSAPDILFSISIPWLSTQRHCRDVTQGRSEILQERPFIEILNDRVFFNKKNGRHRFGSLLYYLPLFLFNYCRLAYFLISRQGSFFLLFELGSLLYLLV
jgi:hypothetical protein